MITHNILSNLPIQQKRFKRKTYPLNYRKQCLIKNYFTEEAN